MCPRAPSIPKPPPPPAEQLDQVAPDRQGRSAASRRGGTGAYRAGRKAGSESSVGVAGQRNVDLSIGGR